MDCQEGVPGLRVVRFVGVVYTRVRRFVLTQYFIVIVDACSNHRIG